VNINSVGVDFDSVLWGLDDNLIKKVKEIYDVTLTNKEVNYYEFWSDKYPLVQSVWKDIEEYKKCEPKKGAIEFFKKLKYITNGNVNIITASHPDLDYAEKDKMIREIFGNVNIIHSSNKFNHTKQSILIDDHLKHIEEHVKYNQYPAIIFDDNYGWNQKFIENQTDLITRAKNYNHALEQVHKF
jgi:5'(3')-deoxyribonucleotidase